MVPFATLLFIRELHILFMMELHILFMRELHILLYGGLFIVLCPSLTEQMPWYNDPPKKFKVRVKFLREGLVPPLRGRTDFKKKYNYTVIKFRYNSFKMI